MMGTKEFSLNVSGNRIKGSRFLPSPRHKKSLGLIVLCHGIPGGQKDPDDPGYPGLAMRLNEVGFEAVHFNFRGAGESSGDFDLLGWSEDLRAVLDYSSAGRSASTLILFGFSAGAAVAVQVAARDSRVNGLVLCGCPADFEGITADPHGFLQHARTIGIVRSSGFPADFPSWENGMRMVRAERWISALKDVPTLILHGDRDDVVPVAHAQRLYAQANEPKDLVIIKGAGHRLRLDRAAMDAAIRWLDVTMVARI
jgi:pimeloyl-ACP methyl ester carboxylesterase